MKAIVTSAIFTGFSSKLDKSLGFRGCTPELSSAEKTTLMDMQGLNVRLLIEPVDFPTDGKMEVKGEFDTKTPSHRLRSVMFVLWKATEEKRGKISFELFYSENMERLIQSTKEAIPEAAF